jgi:hypothetical protein
VARQNPNGTLSTGFAEAVYAPVDGADAASARPFAAALIYPVVTMAVPGMHPTSRELLLGANPLPSQVARRSAELHVGAACACHRSSAIRSVRLQPDGPVVSGFRGPLSTVE